MSGPLGPVHWLDVVDRPNWRWGRVTSLTPLTVSFVGMEPEDDGVDTDTLVAGLAIEDRVWCQLVGRGTAKQVVILGRAGG